ncbi:precorrin-6A/cobalt-precorrin-6A reductase [Alkalimarinus coralli]|uniref:precorrin-6A/cobalt-precorrin-6A reductase n=1 Tax=Alkalimarinus coralli TaxID=2935863 RepID=UPI00202B74E1|nr:precorrin-6A/cobalt-precorrin-6A reductase [Alkalimarinus coralli]
MNILLLGGTRDAINIANSLLAGNQSGDQTIKLIYSIAGIVRKPLLDCTVHTGGFSQFSSTAPLTIDDKTSTQQLDNRSQLGMKRFLQQHHIEKVIDATHPYAITISNNASIVCEQLNIPLLHYVRPPWQATPKDHWITVSSWSEAKKAMHLFKRPFVTIGRLAINDAHLIPDHQFWLIRSAVESNQTQQRYRLVKAIGPFTEQDEIELLKTNHIDVVVCKNSGGRAVDGKLNAAQKLKLPVIMLNRPETGSDYSTTYNNEHDLIKAIR